MDFGDIVDTRDIQERIDEIEDDIDTLENEMSDLEEEIDELIDSEEDGNQNIIDLKLDEIEEKVGVIKDLKEELDNLLNIKSEVPEFEEGNTLIHENYWVEYVQDLVTDCGYISSDLPWWIEIDWDRTADNVAQDYSTIEIEGNTYYYRR